MVAFNSPSLRLVESDSAMEETGIAGRITGSEYETAIPKKIGMARDRRIFQRQEISLRVRGRRMDHSVDALREPILNLSLNDVSVGGIRATSQTRLRVGERVAVFFPPQGGGRGWDAYGRVLRVLPDTVSAGCTVAVEFDTPLAA